ncbi:hypothetical protein BBO01nite_19680 [Brevibacillus borstelensis]|nr:hypothetical protein BBO01nite_19680 [Brevibacillus borstelensis]
MRRVIYLFELSFLEIILNLFRSDPGVFQGRRIWAGNLVNGCSHDFRYLLELVLADLVNAVLWRMIPWLNRSVDEERCRDAYLSKRNVVAAAFPSIVNGFRQA